VYSLQDRIIISLLCKMLKLERAGRVIH